MSATGVVARRHVSAASNTLDWLFRKADTDADWSALHPASPAFLTARLLDAQWCEEPMLLGMEYSHQVCWPGNPPGPVPKSTGSRVWTRLTGPGWPYPGKVVAQAVELVLKE